MADYFISHDKLMAALCDGCEFEGKCDPTQVTCAERNLINSIPAADVVERKRGEWVKAKGSWFTPGGDPVWECSECGKGRHVYGVEYGSYGADVADGQWVSCPNCGAVMRPLGGDV